MPEVIDFAVPGALARFQRAFTAHIRDAAAAPPAAVATERMALYARLVFGNVERVMANMFPVLKSVLPVAQWELLVRAFFRDHPLHDPLFRTMPGEFVRYLEARGPQAGEAPFLLELAHYEWVDYALAVDETEIDLAGIARDGELLAGMPVLNPLVWMLRYDYPVHTFRVTPPPAQAPSAPTYLVACRRCDDRVEYFELTSVSARLLELAEQEPGLNGAALISTLAVESGAAGDADFEAHATALLEAFRARDVLLGTRLEV